MFMKIHELLEYKTKSGKDITFEYHEDFEGDKNRGWQVDKIDAYVDGEYAGYIKLSYIPKERFKRYYPSVLNFMTQIGGGHILPYKKGDVDYKTLSDEELTKVLKNLIHKSRRYRSIWDDKEIPNERKEIIAAIDDIIKNGLKHSNDEFKKFAEYWVDKPIVDYIRVFGEGEDRSQPRFGVHASDSPTDFKRQRIGTALYLEAADYLKQKGLKLYASGLQSDEAQGAWANLEKMNKVASDGDRRYIKA